jgi:hypothetical protein
MQDRSLPPIHGFPFENWRLPSPYDKLTPGGWAALEACVAPGRGGLYLYRKGRVGWAVACPPFVVFSHWRCISLAADGRVLRQVSLADSDGGGAGAVDAVHRIARALQAHPEIGEKILEPRAEVMPEPAAGMDPAWEWTVRHLAIAYRARALDDGTWGALAREIFLAAHRARDLIRTSASGPPAPAPTTTPAPDSKVIAFAEIVRRSAGSRKEDRGA